MNWRKIGRIFEPARHSFKGGVMEFAQSPQALVLNDCVRIYFSTRTRDTQGTYLSHIAFADFDRKMENLLRVHTDPIITLGSLGTFDEHGIFPINVVKYEGKVYAFTCGWSRRVSVPVETSIGLAVSRDDGLTFEKIGSGPILTSSLQEPFLVGDPFVTIDADGWHMWYIYGTKWMKITERETSPARVYKIGFATSNEGIEWSKRAGQLIPDRLNADECQALPTVIKIRNRHHMYFCYREATDFRNNKNRGYRIGYSYSDDLQNWVRDDGNSGIQCSTEGWDSDMMCYPNVFRCDDNIHLLYNGNEFGRYGFGLASLQAQQ